MVKARNQPLVSYFFLAAVAVAGVVDFATACEVSNMHITLGDYFSNRDSTNMFRVGFMLNGENCAPFTLNVIFPRKGGKEKDYNKSYCRIYDFSGTYNHKRVPYPVDYHRRFCFFDLEDLDDPERFTYSLRNERGLVALGPFPFSSRVASAKDSKQDLDIAVFGDHDNHEVGTKTIRDLEARNYDVIIFLGDVAYEIFTNDGRDGDEYFAAIEKLITKAPYVLIPGNHENIDSARFLNSRFRMPGTQATNPDGNNLFSFQVADMFFVGLNLEVLLVMRPNEFNAYLSELEQHLKEARSRSTVKWVGFFAHRPLYCSEYDAGHFCHVIPYYFKPFDDVLNKYDTNLYLYGHVHNYQRFDRLHGYRPVDKRGSAQIICGIAGNKNKPDDENPFNVQFKKLHLTHKVGYSMLYRYENKLQIDLIETSTLVKLDQVTLLKGAEPKKWGRTIFIIIAVVLVLAIAAAALFIVMRRRAVEDGTLVKLPKDEPKLLTEEFVVERIET